MKYKIMVFLVDIEHSGRRLPCRSAGYSISGKNASPQDSAGIWWNNGGGDSGK